MAREDIDPQLPYIQIHRSVGAKAAQIAPALGVSYQHARGAMEVFWEMLADRRILDIALQRETPAIVLTDSDCRSRLKFAFGVDLDPELFVMVGFLDPSEGGYRVRGMSRYLVAEAGRLTKKSKRTDATPVAPRSRRGTRQVEPESDPGKARDERQEEKGKNQEKPPHNPLGEQGSATGQQDEEEQNAFWEWAQAQREELQLPREAERPALLGDVVTNAVHEFGRTALANAYVRFLRDKHFRDSGWPMGVFIRPKVWRPRAHERPAAERDLLTGGVIP
jgi:hypothetical protein